MSFDTVREIVDVAVSVLEDYGEDSQETRIARMAHWILLNLGVDVTDRQLGSVSKISTDVSSISVIQVGSRLALHSTEPLKAIATEHARQLATALLICVERSERYISIKS